jgi:hypothetical protein
MNTWEYRVIQCGGYSGNQYQLQRSCNELGAEGWELAGSSPILVEVAKDKDTDWLLIFKRPSGDLPSARTPP